MQLLYGMRTSLYTALVATVAMVFMGIVIGLIGGYFGGRVDYWLGRLTDFLLAFPNQLFMIAAMPVITAVFVAPDEETPTYIHALAIIGVLWFLGWMGLARLIRAVTLSLREREFVEAAKVAGASPWRIIRKDCCPTSSHRSWCRARTCCPAPFSRSRSSPSSEWATSNRPRLGPDVRHRVGHLRAGPRLHVLPGCRHGRLRRGVQPPRGHRPGTPSIPDGPLISARAAATREPATTGRALQGSTGSTSDHYSQAGGLDSMSILSSRRGRTAVAAVAVGALALAGCSSDSGSSNNKSKDKKAAAAQSGAVTMVPPPTPRACRGGRGCQVRRHHPGLSGTDFSHLDPGQSYVSDAGLLSKLISAV